MVLLMTGGLWAIITPKKIKCKTDYVQPETFMSFPLKFKQYDRVSIYSFDNYQTNVGITYQSRDGLTITIYIYPAYEGMEDRLRNQFLMCLQQMTETSIFKKRSNQELVSYSKNGYKVNGLSARVILSGVNSFLSVYECGEWFFKIRISGVAYGSQVLVKNAEQDMLKQFDPTKLVKEAPLHPYASITMMHAALKDSLMLGCQLESAFSKSKWAKEHVDSLERVSGFPGLYIDLQVEGLKKTLEFAREHPAMSRSASTEEYLAELNMIDNSGFMKEFIRDQFIVNMIGDSGTVANVEGYAKWKKRHPLKINLDDQYYRMYYKTQTKQKSLEDTVDVLYTNKLDSCVNTGFDSLQSNNYLIVTKIDEANEDYIEILCNRLKENLTRSGCHVRILYSTSSNEAIWADIALKSKVANMLMLIPDDKYSRQSFSSFGDPIVSLKREYTVKKINRKTNYSVSKKISISYRDDHLEQAVEKAYDNIQKI